MEIKEEAVEKVLNRLDALALKLGTTAEHLWEILVKQAHITFYGYCIRYILAACFLCFAIWFIPYSLRKFFHEDFQGDCVKGGFSIAGFCICCALTLACIIGTIGEITTFISLYANPEFFAFEKISRLIGN